jgi:hypothetical protein
LASLADTVYGPVELAIFSVHLASNSLSDPSKRYRLLFLLMRTPLSDAANPKQRVETPLMCILSRTSPGSGNFTLTQELASAAIMSLRSNSSLWLNPTLEPLLLGTMLSPARRTDVVDAVRVTTLPGWAPVWACAGALSERKGRMANSHQGIDRPKGEEQPTDKPRAQTSHQTDPDKSASREGTRDPKQRDVPNSSGATRGDST